MEEEQARELRTSVAAVSVVRFLLFGRATEAIDKGEQLGTQDPTGWKGGSWHRLFRTRRRTEHV